MNIASPITKRGLRVKSAMTVAVFALLLLYPLSISAKKFKTDVFSERVKTLRTNPVDNWQALPVIALEGGAQIEITFDVLGASPERYTYTLTHCNADWTPSQLIRSEYMSGFQNLYIEDYAISFNTTVEYVNYRMTFPNEDITMKVSGNYVVQVFPEHENTPVLSACFSVLEQEADISMQVTSQTDKGMNNFYQQVNFEINYGDEVKTPMQDLKMFVRQNNRIDNEAALVKPISVQYHKLVYAHNPNLIFEGGNEYRSFEMTTHKYNGLNIETIEYHKPYYHIVLKPDGIRSNRPYTYAEDINGRIYIRTLSGVEYDYEADYRIVHFYHPCDKPYKDPVYILSNAFQNQLDARSKMEYSEKDKGYVKSEVLKEGYYNYLYVTQKDKESPTGTALIEGNFYQTENEYSVWVYFRPIGGRYDRFIGFQTIQFK